MAGDEHLDAVTRVVIVDDNADERLYFKDILASSKDFAFVGEFSSATELLTGIPLLKADLAMVDVCMPGVNGIECAKRLKQRMPALRIVIITGSYKPDLIGMALQAGADAYLMKPVDSFQCLATLQFAAVQRLANGFPTRKLTGNIVLTRRENEVLQGLADGLLYKEISDKLGISYSMVHKYQHKIFQKLGVSNRSEAVRFWFENNRSCE